MDVNPAQTVVFVRPVQLQDFVVKVTIVEREMRLPKVEFAERVSLSKLQMKPLEILDLNRILTIQLLNAVPLHVYLRLDVEWDGMVRFQPVGVNHALNLVEKNLDVQEMKD